jgi:ParB-like chromosome segregation protein Spo0J
VDIPVVIRDLTDRECRRVWISENIHRRNLSTRETILGNYMLVVDKVSELTGKSEDSNVPGTLEKLSEGEISGAIAALIAGGEVRHKQRTVQQHVLIAQGLISDLQELVFSDRLTQKAGASIAVLPVEDQQQIANDLKEGKIAISQLGEVEKTLKKTNKEFDKLTKDYEMLEKQLEKLGTDEEALVNVKLEQARKKHEKELERLAEEKQDLLRQVETLGKQAELIATKAKYDKLINSVLLLDGMAARGTPDEAMSSRLQFGVLDDGFVMMMENVSHFLADCVKATKKQAFQDRAKSKILSINR